MFIRLIFLKNFDFLTSSMIIPQCSFLNLSFIGHFLINYYLRVIILNRYIGNYFVIRVRTWRVALIHKHHSFVQLFFFYTYIRLVFLKNLTLKLLFIPLSFNFRSWIYHFFIAHFLINYYLRVVILNIVGTLETILWWEWELEELLLFISTILSFNCLFLYNKITISEKLHSWTLLFI